METEALYAQETKQFDLGKALIKREEELKKTEPSVVTWIL